MCFCGGQQRLFADDQNLSEFGGQEVGAGVPCPSAVSDTSSIVLSVNCSGFILK